METNPKAIKSLLKIRKENIMKHPPSASDQRSILIEQRYEATAGSHSEH